MMLDEFNELLGVEQFSVEFRDGHRFTAIAEVVTLMDDHTVNVDGAILEFDDPVIYVDMGDDRVYDIDVDKTPVTFKVEED